MRRLYCRCERPVFFNNHQCVHCGRQLAFDSRTLTMDAEPEPGAGLPFCANRHSAVRCNWLADAGNATGYCLSCSLSKIIPSLNKPENLERWRKLEAAKRRLVYDLLSIGLPVDRSRLRFEFKEDGRTNPFVGDQFVSTGHRAGVITINAAEADEVFREKMRQQMNEPWRTLLSHMRHESGHYYFDLVVDDANRDDARAVFGDETVRYDQTLEQYYRNGPPADWRDRYISAYASAHPAEDWAECWAHYLHIRAILETAAAANLVAVVTDGDWYDRFIELVVSLNEIMRSLGLPDAYPFVLNKSVAQKIDFVHHAVAQRYD